MSFGAFNKQLGSVQGILTLALTLIVAIGIFYTNLDLSYKISIAIFAFVIMFLASLANTIIQMQKEARKQQTS
jgi:uncharacterized membrane protein YGL010W